MIEQLLTIMKAIQPRELTFAKTESLKTLRSFVMSSTKFMDGEHKIPYTMASRVYAVINGLVEIPRCECGELCPPDRKSKGWGNGFAKSCSDICSRKRNRIGDAKLFLSNRDWLYEQRITLKKSIDQIAEELGVSHGSVGDWINKNNIPKIRLTESEPEVKMLLRDKELLFHLHKNKNKTCGEIAEMIGSSKATVSIALKRLGIIPNDTNVYDRKNVKTSKWQQEITDYIKSIYDGVVMTNKRGIIGSDELDIYLPNIKLAIECNGVFYHQYQPEQQKESARKGINYHLNKTKKCEAIGITLLHFFDISWCQKSDIIKSMIASRIGTNQTRIYARKCTIKEIDTSTKNLFLDNNHFQGKDKSSIYYGLYHDGILVSVMTFGKSRFNTSYTWELMRYSSLLNHSVIGGFSKLLKNFRTAHEGSIISYADRMYSVGNVYKQNGFVLSHINRPSYYYIDFNKNLLLHRANFRKSKINAIGMTEEEKMRSDGYGKIFDCGNYAFVIK
jgi:transposase